LLRLTTFPTEQSELSAWWVSELGIKPPKPKYVEKKPSPGVNAPDDDDDEVMVDGEENQDGGDDWRNSSTSPLQTTFQVQGHLNPERGCIH
jgi:U3 small nucleolar RNA-associated protein 19